MKLKYGLEFYPIKNMPGCYLAGIVSGRDRYLKVIITDENNDVSVFTDDWRLIAHGGKAIFKGLNITAQYFNNQDADDFDIPVNVIALFA